MAPLLNSTTKNKVKPPGKKEKVFHPQSRKAGQLERTQLRKAKLAELASKKLKRESAQIDKFVFFYHAIPPEVVAMTLSQTHDLIRDVWLKRFDLELERERSARRKGRPKSSKQVMFEEIILRETEEYRTGFEIPDLTHAPTVTLLRSWDQVNDLENCTVCRLGKHESLVDTRDVEMEEHKELVVGEDESVGT